jgi:hypothetical protein
MLSGGFQMILDAEQGNFTQSGPDRGRLLAPPHSRPHFGLID